MGENTYGTIYKLTASTLSDHVYKDIKTTINKIILSLLFD